MSLSAAELEALLAELAPRWSDSTRIQKIDMAGPHVVMLTLRANRTKSFLTLSVEPRSAFLAVTPERPLVKDREPSAFCMALRKVLKGKRMTGLFQLESDRVVEVRATRAVLVAEMFGQSGALLLVDNGIVRATSPERTRSGIHRGQPYEPPERSERLDDRSRRCRFEAGAVLDGVIASYVDTVEARLLEDGRIRAVASLRGRLTKARRLVARIEGDLDRAREAEGVSRKGELLKLVLPTLRRGMASVEVEDILFGTGDLVKIPLDPTKKPSENLSFLFKKARRLERARQLAATRLQAKRQELSALESLSHCLESPDLDSAGLAEVHRALGLLPSRTRRVGKTKRPAAPRLPYHRFETDRGQRILVGRGAADNDTLTLQIAKPHDLWLHAKGTKGSHVIVPLDRGADPTPEALVDGATLAAHFSDRRGASPVEVSYTHRRYVRKQKGFPPGMVSLIREKVIVLHLEPERLARLLESRDQGVANRVQASGQDVVDLGRSAK